MSLALVLTIIGGLILGTVVAFINSLISKKAMTGGSNAVALGINAVRFALDVAALALAFLICKVTGLNMLAGLIPTAFGLTVFGMIFLIIVTKKVSREMSAEKQEIISEVAGETETGKNEEN